MNISRRSFLSYCRASSVMLGLSALDLLRLEELLADPAAPTLLWLQGSGCTGCSVSFLNYIAATSAGTETVADVLIKRVNLAFHQTVMDASGQTVVNVVDSVYAAASSGRKYYLVVEGGVPTAFGGNACLAWTRTTAVGRIDVTLLDAVKTLSTRASGIISVGTCAAWGGISAAYPNLTGVKGVGDVTGKRTINIAGCPPHPDWIVWGIVRVLTNTVGSLDDFGRPEQLFPRSVHDRCPRKEGERYASAYGQDGRCLKELGCLGPKCRAGCPSTGWNNGVNWCVDANTLCIGCTEPGFPVSQLRGAQERG
jgi:hydrogenase small subunit